MVEYNWFLTRFRIMKINCYIVTVFFFANHVENVLCTNFSIQCTVMCDGELQFLFKIENGRS